MPDPTPEELAYYKANKPPGWTDKDVEDFFSDTQRNPVDFWESVIDGLFTLDDIPNILFGSRD